MQRRAFFSMLVGGLTLSRVRLANAQEMTRDVFLERRAPEMPHKGKVLLAVQAHSDDIPLFAAGTVAKLVSEGYTGYLLRATNDDMGDAPGLGTPGTIGQNVLGNEHDNDEIARILGLKRVFNFNYGNHRMGDVSQNELQCRLIFLIRLLKVDTVICWDPWAHDNDDETADRNYIKEFLLARNRELGQKYGTAYAEPFHYIGPAAPSPVEDYVRKNAVPVGG